MNTVENISEGKADWLKRAGEPGFYVVNPLTGLAVAGPFGRARSAEMEAARRDAMYPFDSTSLEVVLSRKALNGDTE